MMILKCLKLTEKNHRPRETKQNFTSCSTRRGQQIWFVVSCFEKSLKLSAHILVDISYPLENSYYRALERISQGWTEQEAFISGRSAGEWLVTVHEIMQVLEFDAFHNHLELSQCMRLERPPSPNNWPVWALGEETVLDEAYCFWGDPCRECFVVQYPPLAGNFLAWLRLSYTMTRKL